MHNVNYAMRGEAIQVKRNLTERKIGTCHLICAKLIKSSSFNWATIRRIIILLITNSHGSSGDSGQNQSLLIGVNLHYARRLQLLSNPVALLQGVDEHELATDTATVGVLETLEDVTEGQRLFGSSDEGGGREFEDAIHIAVL